MMHGRIVNALKGSAAYMRSVDRGRGQGKTGMKVRVAIVAAALLFACGLAAPLSCAAEEVAEVEVPAWLEARIGGLAAEQREFLLSDKAEGFTGTRARLHQRLENTTSTAGK
jgi:hypothetical protein